jgi:hypothetical protein
MKKTQIIKEDIYQWYRSHEFENTIQYGKQHRDVEGVDKYLSELQKKRQDYEMEMNALIKTENPSLDDGFRAWSSAEKTKGICIKVGISLFILFFTSIFVKFLDILTVIALLGAFFGCIAAIVLKIVSLVLKSRYHACFESVSGKAGTINRKYLHEIPAIWNKIDDLYLASLEPTHRETVLMRRDQERQHQENMRMQEKILQSQKIAEEEQKRTRRAQEEALQIERSREERYRKNRY